MKAMILFLFRLCSGVYLLAWAGDKFVNGADALDISDAYYFEAASHPAFHFGIGMMAAIVGVFVILGLFRIVVYPLQVCALALNAAIMGMAIITPLATQPLDAAIAVDMMKALLPLCALLMLAIAPIVWWRDDWVALDELTRRSETSAAPAPVFVDFPVERPDQYHPQLRAASYAEPAAYDAHAQDAVYEDGYDEAAYEQQPYETADASHYAEDISSADQEPQEERFLAEAQIESRAEAEGAACETTTLTDTDDEKAAAGNIDIAVLKKDEESPPLA